MEGKADGLMDAALVVFTLQCLLKPPVKENTRPLDLKLHTDLRALERAEFDQQVKTSLWDENQNLL